MKIHAFWLMIILISMPSAMAADEALRAYLGLAAASKTLVQIDTDIPYVAAVARFEKGNFLGYDRISNGIIDPKMDSSATFEILWGKKGGNYGYVFVCDTSIYDFKVDPIFEHLKSGSTGKATANGLKYGAKFRDMTILASSFGSLPKGKTFSGPLNARINEELKSADYAVLLLFRPCASLEETLTVMQSLACPPQTPSPVP